MDLTVPGHRIKSKFGDELSLHATPNHLKLSTISPARSAFTLFTFEPSFFSKYKITAKPERRGDPPAVQLQILGKTLHDIFKQQAVASAQRISLSISAADFARAEDSTAAAHQCRLTITVFCPHGIRKTYRLTYHTAALMVALANKDECTSSVTASPRIVKDWTDHFMPGRHGTDEITFWYTSRSCKVRSYEDVSLKNAAAAAAAGAGTAANGKKRAGKETDGLSRQSISTTLTLDTAEFDVYNLNDADGDANNAEVLITVTLKEFKAIIELAAGVANSLEMHFSQGGDPLIASLDTDSLDVQFVLSTNADDPAGITREKAKEETKPRLSQARLSAIPRQSTAVRGNSSLNGNGNRSMSSAAPARLASQPASTSRGAKAPLFRPDEEGDSKPVITLDDDDDEDGLWADLDAAEPEFSQMAVDLDNALQSTQQPQNQRKATSSRDGQAAVGDAIESALANGEMAQGRDLREHTEAETVPETGQAEKEQAGPAELEMSLDDFGGESPVLSEEEAEQGDSSRTKKRRKNYDLGLT